jgi:3-oxoacyl-[acyl-carrier protein] reductase
MRKHYLIIGASRGIGLAVAQHVALLANRVTTVSRTPCSIGSWIKADVTTDDGIDAIKNSIGSEPLDALMYLGGCWEETAFTDDYSFLKSSRSETRNIISTNLIAPILIAQAFAPNLAAAENARVILMGSESGLDNAAPKEVAYCASKFGLRGVAQSLAVAFQPDQIGVTLINPGDVATPEVLADIDACSMKTQGLIPLSDIIKSIDLVLSSSPNTVPSEINLIPQKKRN